MARHAKELQDFDAAAAAAGGGAAAVSQQAAAAADGSAAEADSASKYLKDLSVGDAEGEEAEGKGKVRPHPRDAPARKQQLLQIDASSSVAQMLSVQLQAVTPA